LPESDLSTKNGNLSMTPKGFGWGKSKLMFYDEGCILKASGSGV
jgi:hypothetical protein